MTMESDLLVESNSKGRKQLQDYLKGKKLQATGTTEALRHRYLNSRRATHGLSATAETIAPPPSQQKTKTKPPKWTQNSKPRQLLYWDLTNDNINEDMTASTVHKMRPEYKQYDEVAFARYLDTMRQHIVNKKSRSHHDAAAVANFYNHHPKKMVNAKGEPRWEGSKAEEYLIKDMEKGKHLKMKPHELRAKRPEYKEFYPKTFSSKIDQLTRKKKFERYVTDKAAKKMEKLGLQKKK